MDDKDLIILQTVRNRPGVSLVELQEVIQVHSIGTVHNRVRELERKGLLEAPPRKKMARSRKVSAKGLLFLKENGV
jgi:hypothetical protein